MGNYFTSLSPIALRVMLCVSAIFLVLWVVSFVLAIKTMIQHRFKALQSILWVLLFIWTGGIAFPFLYLSTNKKTQKR